jgi:TRAP-type C4-dicarboxylate transport system permease small subunit
MTWVAGPLRRFLVLAGYVELCLAMLILTGLLATIGSQVFSRYVLGMPLIWVEELASYLLIWLGFMSAAVAHKQGRHIRIAILAGIKSQQFHLWLFLFAEAVVIVFAGILLWYVPGPMAIEARSTSIGLPVDIARHWFFSVPLTIGTASMMLTSVHNLVVGIADRATGRPPEPILGTFGDHEDAEGELIESELRVDPL